MIVLKRWKYIYIVSRRTSQMEKKKSFALNNIIIAAIVRKGKKMII